MTAELLHRAARAVSERAYRGDWVTALPDEVAFTLAAWLRGAAEDAEQIGADFRAVAFARAVLDEEES